MQEVLSKPGSEKLPLSEQEFYVLRIDDAGDTHEPCFIVKQSRVRWSETDKRFLSEESEYEQWPMLQQAQECYDARLQTLRAEGFTQSDMEMF